MRVAGTLVDPMDALWFYADQGAVRAHFGPLLIFRKPDGAPASFVDELVRAWRADRRFQPPFNYRLQRLPVPRWEVLADQDVDIDYHLRQTTLPSPGGERELGVFISRLHSQALDPQRPLWEWHVIDGLADDRFAMYIKFHHGQFDAIGASRLISRALATDPQQPTPPPPWSIAAPSSPEVSKPPADPPSRPAIRNFARDVSVGALRAVESSLPLNAPNGAIPFEAPRTILNGRISPQRRFAVQTFPLERLRALASASSVTVNDVFLTVTGGALRHYLLALDKLPRRSLVAQVPVNVRPKDDASLGNAFTFMLLRLGTDVEDPAERLANIAISSARSRARLASMSRRAITAYTSFVAPVLAPTVLGLGGIGRPPANLVVSNVPGPPTELFVNGAPMIQGYGPSVLFHGQALNITMATYAGQANVSLTGCRVRVPHLQRLAVRVGVELDQLEKAAGS